jgi:hypothetical protein
MGNVKKSKIFKGALIIFLMAAGFLWGFFAHRNQIFPANMIRSLKPKTGTQIKSQSSQLEKLQALPYIKGKYDLNKDARSVILYNPEESYDGYNLYISKMNRMALLIDMEGATIHQWSYPHGNWHHSELLPSGELLVTIRDRMLLKLDRESRVVWSEEGRFHHDLWVRDNGDIYAIKRVARSAPDIHSTVETLDEHLSIFTGEGERKAEISLLNIVMDSPYAFLFPSVSDKNFDSEMELDILHANHIEVFDGKLEDMSPLFQRGNILVTIRNINLVVIIDGSTMEIIWAWGPTNLTLPHHSTLLENGHMLIFNNGVEKSEVLELDPLINQVVWRYAPEEGFFTETRGSNQRLKNGNTLITESDTGYVLEVTPDKRVVWKFANPDVDEDGIRMAIWRMQRFRPDELPFLRKSR